MWVNGLFKYGLLEVCNGMLLVLKTQGFISTLLLHGPPLQVFGLAILFWFFFYSLFFFEDQPKHLMEMNLYGWA